MKHLKSSATEIAPGTPAKLGATYTSQSLVPRAVVVQPTQIRRPWRATVRTIFAAIIGLAAMLPVLVDASGVDETLPGVGGALAIAGGITRVMALPQVEAFMQQFLPFLAAAPPAEKTSRDELGQVDAVRLLWIVVLTLAAILLVVVLAGAVDIRVR